MAKPWMPAGPLQGFRLQPGNPAKTLPSGACTVSSALRARRIALAGIVVPQHCCERLCSFVPPGRPSSRHRCRRPDRANGPARWCRPRVQGNRPGAKIVGDLLSGSTGPVGSLASAIRLRLPTRRAGPDSMTSLQASPGRSKNVGREKPRNPVGKSIGSRRRTNGSMPAMPAVDEAA